MYRFTRQYAKSTLRDRNEALEMKEKNKITNNIHKEDRERDTHTHTNTHEETKKQRNKEEVKKTREEEVGDDATSGVFLLFCFVLFCVFI